MSEGDGNAAGPSAEEAAKVHRAFVEIMNRAGSDPVIGQRLALADIVCHVHMADAPQDLVVTLNLDRKPVETHPTAVGTPDVTLHIRTRDVFRFWAGDFHLAMGVARGGVTYEGPVRKLLRVVPIARRLVGDFLSMVEEQDVRVPVHADAPRADPGAK